MSRFGQGDLRVRNRQVGTVWVSRVAADVAFHPRIELSVGCQVQDLPATEGFPEGVVGFTCLEEAQARAIRLIYPSRWPLAGQADDAILDRSRVWGSTPNN